MFILLGANEVHDHIICLSGIHRSYSLDVQEAVTDRVLRPVALHPRRVSLLKSDCVRIDKTTGIFQVLMLAHVREQLCKVSPGACPQSTRISTELNASL